MQNCEPWPHIQTLTLAHGNAFSFSFRSHWSRFGAIDLNKSEGPLGHGYYIIFYDLEFAILILFFFLFLIYATSPRLPLPNRVANHGFVEASPPMQTPKFKNEAAQISSEKIKIQWSNNSVKPCCQRLSRCRRRRR